MPNFLNHVKGLSATFLTAVFLTGCFEDVPRVDPDDYDTDSDSETTSETTTMDGTDTSDTEDTSGETDDTSGETDTGMPTDMGGGPCDEVITPHAAADFLMEDCSSIFGISACQQDQPMSRSEFIGGLMLGYAPMDLLLCYEDPVEAHYPDVPDDHPAYLYVEQAYFLGAFTEGAFFEPDAPADVCWAEAVMINLLNLPDIIAKAQSGQVDGNFGPGVGPVLATSYLLCGTNMTDHVDFPLTVSNNLDADFTMPEMTDALQDVRLRCETPDGASYIASDYMSLLGGEASFDMLDCYSQSGVPMELQVQVRTAVAGQFRVGLDPDSIAIRGDAYIPLYNVQ